MMEESVFLDYSDNPYETLYVKACLGERGLEVWAMTSEKAPGDRYGFMYRVDGDGLPRLREALGAAEGGLLQAMKERFSGSEAEKRFLEFCTQNDVPYKRFLAH